MNHSDMNSVTPFK